MILAAAPTTLQGISSHPASPVRVRHGKAVFGSMKLTPHKVWVAGMSAFCLLVVGGLIYWIVTA